MAMIQKTGVDWRMQIFLDTGTAEVLVQDQYLMDDKVVGTDNGKIVSCELSAVKTQVDALIAAIKATSEATRLAVEAAQAEEEAARVAKAKAETQD